MAGAEPGRGLDASRCLRRHGDAAGELTAGYGGLSDQPCGEHAPQQHRAAAAARRLTKYREHVCKFSLFEQGLSRSLASTRRQGACRFGQCRGGTVSAQRNRELPARARSTQDNQQWRRTAVGSISCDRLHGPQVRKTWRRRCMRVGVPLSEVMQASLPPLTQKLCEPVV